MIDLSNKAKSICEANYAINCGGCPIRPVCAGRIGPGKEALNRWVEAVNKLAEEVK